MDDVSGQEEDFFFVSLLLTVYRTHADSFHRRSRFTSVFARFIFTARVCRRRRFSGKLDGKEIFHSIEINVSVAGKQMLSLSCSESFLLRIYSGVA